MVARSAGVIALLAGLQLVIAADLGKAIPMADQITTTTNPTTAPTTTTPPTTATPAEAGVPAAQGPLITVESDVQQADNVTGVVTATGNVRVLYPEKKLVATARQAQYFTKEGRIILSGDVDVVQEGGNRLTAQRVTYLVQADRLIADPPAGDQVRSWIRLQRMAPVAPAREGPR
jgi:lipopolysaccharide export system protein LptA